MLLFMTSSNIYLAYIRFGLVNVWLWRIGLPYIVKYFIFLTRFSQLESGGDFCPDNLTPGPWLFIASQYYIRKEKLAY